MSKCLFQISAVLLIFGVLFFSQAVVLHAQVFNPPAAQPNVGVQQAGGPTAVTQTGAVEQTGWGLAMPKLTMPTITMPKLTMPKITMPNMIAVTGPFKSGFSKVTSGTKKAWEGTKEMLSFGKNNTAATSRSRSTGQQQPSFWQRLLVRESEAKIPQTVGEFMSQPRLDP